MRISTGTLFTLLWAATALLPGLAEEAFAFGGKPATPSATQSATHTATATQTVTATHTTTATATGTHTNTQTVTSTVTSTSTQTQGSPARPSNAPDLKVCAGGPVLQGLDVSAYDPNTNWSAVAKGGRGFVFVKATEGNTYVNPDFARDWAGAKAADLLRGAYHFFHPKDDPRTQASEFLRTQGPLGATDLPALLDWEVTDGVSPAVQIASAQIWLEEVKAASGKTPVIYVDPSFYNALGNPIEFAGYPLFIAHYDVACPEVPPPWSKWTFWQKGAGAAAGVTSSQADLDEFNGTADQLLNFARTGTLP